MARIGIGGKKMVKSKIIYDKEKNQAAHEVQIDICGGGGELGIRNIKCLINQINDIPKQKTPEDVRTQADRAAGYLLCCANSGFLSKESALEVTDMLVMLAAQEETRAAAEQRKAQK